MKGYKITESDMTCRGYQYELNKEFILDEDKEGPLELCYSGFHFCEKIENCFRYYTFDNKRRIFEIETLDKIISDYDKSVTNKIIFLRELTREELYEYFSDPKFKNKGNNNIGHGNVGNYNIGKYNTGNHNTGDYNTGNFNIGSNHYGDYNERDFCRK